MRRGSLLALSAVALGGLVGPIQAQYYPYPQYSPNYYGYNRSYYPSYNPYAYGYAPPQYYPQPAPNYGYPPPYYQQAPPRANASVITPPYYMEGVPQANVAPPPPVPGAPRPTMLPSLLPTSHERNASVATPERKTVSNEERGVLPKAVSNEERGVLPKAVSTEAPAVAQKRPTLLGSLMSRQSDPAPAQAAVPASAPASTAASTPAADASPAAPAPSRSYFADFKTRIGEFFGR